jgi:tol-pal system beta propeller repeat protein TolB
VIKDRTIRAALLGAGLGAVVFVCALAVGGAFVVLNTLPPRAPTATPFAEIPVSPTAPNETAAVPPTPAALPTVVNPTLAAPSATTTGVPMTNLTEPPRGKIVFTCYDSLNRNDELCLINADGSGLVRLTQNSVGDFYGSLSPDGQTILFSRQVSGSNYEIFQMDAGGSNVLQLTHNGAENYAPEFSPDGQRIAFTSSHESRAQQIWVMDKDGQNLVRLTSQGENIDATWSRDGQLIAYASNQSGSRQLWVMNSDGSNPRQLTDLPDMGGRSSFSADGRLLAFYTGPRGTRNIYTIGVDGTGLRQLTSEGDNLGPSFSPDGQWITFGGWRKGGNNEIYIIRPDSRDLIRLTVNPASEYQPRWGP